MDPLVSIIVPCYNAAPWLAQTLESALAQTWPRVEIIVIDDGSRDESLAVARGFEPRGVQVVAQANAGASAARNHGLRLARGDFIQYLDADDLLTSDKISAQMAIFAREGTECVATCRWGRFTGDPTTARFVDQAVFRDFIPVDWMLQHTGEAHMMQPAAWLTPRGIADRAGRWDESLTPGVNDDGEYFARVVLAARRIVFSSTGASLYRSAVSGSLSGRRERRALESMFNSVELISAHLLRFEDSPRVRQALATYWQRFVFDVYPAAPDLCRRAEQQSRVLGGSRVRPMMGAREQLASRMLGWKLARRLRTWVSR